MSFLLSEEQTMLQEAAHNFLAEKAGIPQLRKLRDDNDELRFAPSTWNETVDMGWAGISISEEYGGLGFGYVGLGVILQEIGRTLSSLPIESSVLIASTLVNELGRAEQKSLLLPSLASGELRLCAAVQEKPHFDWSCEKTKATRTGDSWQINGAKLMVSDAVGVDKFVLSAEAEGLTQLFIVDADAPGLSVERRITTDARVSAKVTLDNVSVHKENLLGDGNSSPQATETALDRALDIINIGLSAELLGLSHEAFERTINYLKERRQFDSFIGSFQALQHRSAHIYAELELCKSLVFKSLMAIDESSDQLSVLASAAKAKLSDVSELVTNEAIQMHGGIGMTDEYEIGFFIKRARVLQHLFGDANYHYNRFARLNNY